MPPVRPKDALTFLRATFAVATTVAEFLGEKEEGVPTVEALGRASKRLKKRLSDKKKPKKISATGERPATSKKTVDADFIDVEGKVVQ
jgi:hypothetical protein